MPLKLTFAIAKQVPKWILSDGKWIIIFPIILISIPFWIPFFAKFTTFTSVELLGYSGLILRLIGFVMIIIGLNSKLMNYTDGGLCGLYLSWWYKRPWRHKYFYVKTAKADAKAFPIDFSPSVNYKELTLEEKVKYLFDEISRLKHRVEIHEKSTEDSITKIKVDIKEIKKTIISEINKIEDKLELSFIGKIDKEFFGAIAIFLGILYSSIPEEIFGIIS